MPKRSHPGPAPDERIVNAVCPFCPLLCDDLVIDADDAQLAVHKNGCAQAIEAFSRPATASSPAVDGKPVSRTVAIGAAAKILRRATAPLLSGLGTDVDGTRAAVALAEKSHAILDHANSAGIDSGMRVLQSRGWYTTTLAEIRNRADLIVFIGADVVSHYANFMRRIVLPKQTLHRDRRQARRAFYLGEKRLAPESTAGFRVESIAVPSERLAETVSMLRAILSNRAASGGRGRRLGGLADAIAAADYPVFVWAPGQLPRDTADLTISATTRLIDELNRTQRAAGLALGGDNGAMSAANACAWLTGYPLHVSFAGKTIEYDPVRYRTAALLERGAVDALLWVDAFGQSPLPQTPDGIKRIAIGFPGLEANRAADVFIPVGIPGVDHDARLVRTDSVVTLRLDQLRARRSGSAAEVLRDIAAEW